MRWSAADAVVCQYGWCASIRGVENGGLVEGLATHNFRTDEGDVALKCPGISITDRREKELADQDWCRWCTAREPTTRLFSACRRQQAQGLRQAGGQCQRAALGAASVHAGHVPLCALLKAMMRDKLGSTMSRSQAEQYLNQWIANYVVMDDMHLLRQGREAAARGGIEVVEIAGKPGALRAVAFLRPHFQLDELTVS